jgi:hypothetical protein
VTWVNFDDQFPNHPKVFALSDGAYRLHSSGICYCNQFLTDGIVPAERLPKLMPRYRPGYLQELTDRLMWIDIGEGHYEIHDYLDWNKSRAEVEKRRAARQSGGREGARRRWEK